MKWRIWTSNRFKLNFKLYNDVNKTSNYIEYQTFMLFPLLHFPKLLVWRINRRKENMERLANLLNYPKDT